MLERAIHLNPGSITAAVTGSNQKICALTRQAVKKRIISGADTALQVGLAWTLGAGFRKPACRGD